MDMYTMLYLKWKTSKDLLYRTGNLLSVMWQPGWEGSFGEECMHVCSVISVVSDFLRPHGLQPTRLLCPWDFPSKNTGMGCHFLLQGTSPTQGSNPSFLHWQADSLPLSQGENGYTYMCS